MDTGPVTNQPSDQYTSAARAAWLLPALLLGAGLTGFQVAGIPASMAILAAALLFLAISRREMRLPSWPHTALLAAVCLGMLPLDPQQLGTGIREAVQFIAIFGAAWLVFASLTPPERRILGGFLAVVCVAGIGWAAAARWLGVPQHLSGARLALVTALSLPFLLTWLAARAGMIAAGLALCAFGAVVQDAGLLMCGAAGAAVAIAIGGSRYRWVLAAAGAFGAVGASIMFNSSAWDRFDLRHDDTHLKRLMVEYQATPGAVAAKPLVGHGLGTYKDAIKHSFRSDIALDDTKIVPDTNSTYAILAVEAGLPAALLLAVLLTGTAFRAVKAGRGPERSSAGRRFVAPDLAATGAAGAAVSLALAGLFTALVTRHTGIAAACAAGMACSSSPRTVLPALRRWIPRLGLIGAAAAACLAYPMFSGHFNGGGSPAPPDDSLIISRAAGTSAKIFVYEAENTLRPLKPPLCVQPANDASGNSVLAIPLDAGKGQGFAAYSFPGLPDGDYAVWQRVWWTDGCSDSIACVVGEEMAVVSDGIHQRWHWLRPVRTFHLTSQTELRLVNREDGIMVDQILLTTDSGYQPRGIAGN